MRVFIQHAPLFSTDIFTRGLPLYVVFWIVFKEKRLSDIWTFILLASVVASLKFFILLLNNYS